LSRLVGQEAVQTLRQRSGPAAELGLGTLPGRQPPQS